MRALMKRMVVSVVAMGAMTLSASAQITLVDTVNASTTFPGRVTTPGATGQWSGSTGSATPQSFFSASWTQNSGNAGDDVNGAVRVSTDNVAAGQSFRVTGTLTYTGADINSLPPNGAPQAFFGQSGNSTDNYQQLFGQTLVSVNSVVSGNAINFAFDLTGSGTGTNVITILVYLGTQSVLGSDFWTISNLTVAPEINSKNAVAPIALVLGGLLLAYDSRRRKSLATAL